MQQRALNSSTFSTQYKALLWRVEWLFDAEQLKFADEQLNEHIPWAVAFASLLGLSVSHPWVRSSVPDVPVVPPSLNTPQPAALAMAAAAVSVTPAPAADGAADPVAPPVVPDLSQPLGIDAWTALLPVSRRGPGVSAGSGAASVLRQQLTALLKTASLDDVALLLPAPLCPVSQCLCQWGGRGWFRVGA